MDSTAMDAVCWCPKCGEVYKEKLDICHTAKLQDGTSIVPCIACLIQDYWIRAVYKGIKI